MPINLVPTIALALAAVQPEPAPYNCQANLDLHATDQFGWVNLRLGRRWQPVGRELYVRDSRFDSVWNLDAGPPSRPDAMRAFDYILELPIGTAFPVMVAAAADRRPLWSGTFDRSSGTILHSPPQEPSASIRLIGGRGRPIRNIFGIRELRVTVRDAHRTVIADVLVPMPDWRRVAAQVRVALREVERQRLASRCHLSAIP